MLLLRAREVWAAFCFAGVSLRLLSSQVCELSSCAAAWAEGRRSHCPFLHACHDGCSWLGESRGAGLPARVCGGGRWSQPCWGRWPGPCRLGGRGAGSSRSRRRGSACRWQCLRGAAARCGAGDTKGAPPQGTPSSLRCPGLPKEPQPPREAGDVPARAPGLCRTRQRCPPSSRLAAGVLRLRRMETLPAGRLPVTSYPAPFPFSLLFLSCPSTSRGSGTAFACWVRRWASPRFLRLPPSAWQRQGVLSHVRHRWSRGEVGPGSSANS